METFGEIIARRRRGEETPEDFLQSMLQRDSLPASEKLDDSEIMDNLLTLIIAGQTTTAAAMMWSVKFLHDNRETQDILRVRYCTYSSETMDPNPIKDFFFIIVVSIILVLKGRGNPSFIFTKSSSIIVK